VLGCGVGEVGHEYAQLAIQREVVESLFSQYEQSAPALRDFLAETDSHIRAAAHEMTGTLKEEESVLEEAMEEVKLARLEGQGGWEEEGHVMTWDVESVERLKEKLKEDGSSLLLAMRAYMEAQFQAANDPEKHQERLAESKAFVMAEIKKTKAKRKQAGKKRHGGERKGSTMSVESIKSKDSSTREFFAETTTADKASRVATPAAAPRQSISDGIQATQATSPALGLSFGSQRPPEEHEEVALAAEQRRRRRLRDKLARETAQVAALEEERKAQEDTVEELRGTMAKRKEELEARMNRFEAERVAGSSDAGLTHEEEEVGGEGAAERLSSRSCGGGGTVPKALRDSLARGEARETQKVVDREARDRRIESRRASKESVHSVEESVQESVHSVQSLEVSESQEGEGGSETGVQKEDKGEEEVCGSLGGGVPGPTEKDREVFVINMAYLDDTDEEADDPMGDPHDKEEEEEEDEELQELRHEVDRLQAANKEMQQRIERSQRALEMLANEFVPDPSKEAAPAEDLEGRLQVAKGELERIQHEHQALTVELASWTEQHAAAEAAQKEAEEEASRYETETASSREEEEEEEEEEVPQLTEEEAKHARWDEEFKVQTRLQREEKKLKKDLAEAAEREADEEDEAEKALQREKAAREKAERKRKKRFDGHYGEILNTVERLDKQKQEWNKQVTPTALDT